MFGLAAPYPYFGGKSRAAELVWPRLGDVDVYLEPFAGSLAMLLARPNPRGVELANDIDGYVINFWRAAVAEPEAVAVYADAPIHEVEKAARHHWLVTEGRERLERLVEDPDYFDSQVAGYWLYGIAIWIGRGFCTFKEGPDGEVVAPRQLPHLGPGRGVNRKVPGASPGDPGYAAARGAFIRQMIVDLQDRVRDVKFTCGDWKRLLAPSITIDRGVVGVFLDPPYMLVGRSKGVYRNDTEDPAREALAWAIEHGDDPRWHIAICGYDGDYVLPMSWTEVPWKAQGGYGNLADEDGMGKENAHRERIWFSPHCIERTKPTQASLFAALAEGGRA